MVILSLLLSHLIYVYYFARQKLIYDFVKRFFVVVVPLLSWFVCFDSNLGYHVVLTALFLSVCHEFIDWVIIKLESVRYFWSEKRISNIRTRKIMFLVVGQLSHLTVILLTSGWFLQIDLWDAWKKLSVKFNIAEGVEHELSTVASILAIFIIFIGVTSVSGQLVRILAGDQPSREQFFEEKITLENSLENFLGQSNEQKMIHEWSYIPLTKSRLSQGGFIGYVERIIVMILAYYSAYPAIAFIATAKSLIRFKQLEDRDFAEYFLVGTLSSIPFGIMSGVILRLVFR